MHKTLFLALSTILALAACSKTPTVSSAGGSQKEIKETFDAQTAAPDMQAQLLGDYKTGAQLSQQIVNGVISERGARPYQVALYNIDGKQFCGGTLISPTWVLTAAHCIFSDRLIVRAGVNKLSDREQGAYYTVARAIKHPAYVSSTQGYDIALLELVEPVAVRHAAIAGLPSPVLDSALTVAGRRAVVSGWGDLFSGARAGSDDLREVEIPITPNPISCGRNRIAPNVICGNAEEGKDSCQGDSGGPLASQFNGQHYVLGVVSYGVGCSGDGVYTRVSPYTKWIEDVSGVKADVTNPNIGVDLAPPSVPAVEYRAYLDTRKHTYAPSAEGFFATGGSISASLTGPSGTDFDLYLQRKNDQGIWQTVAYSVSEDSNEQISTKLSSAASYRWVTYSYIGSGETVLREVKQP